MKINTMLIHITLCICFLFPAYSFANEDCEKQEDIFKKYECRKKKVCEVEAYTDNKKVYKQEAFKEAEYYIKNKQEVDIFSKTSREEYPIKKAISVYKENMNGIYKCAMITIQKNSIQDIKQRLLKLDRTGDVKKNIEPKIENMLNRLDMIAKSSNCTLISKESFNKLGILKQTTQTTCDYGFYIEYLKDYYKDPKNALYENFLEETKEDGTKVFNNVEAAKKIGGIETALDEEFNHSVKIFSIAFHAYSEYENNFPIHFLLEILKEDYMIFREKLHKVINPINQVVYKISNAMKK